jgi:hypothetical protein
MIQKTSPAGWVVQVSISAPPTPPRADGTRWIGADVMGAPSFQYYNVAIAAPSNALEATAKHLAAANAADGEKSVVRELSAGEIAALKLKAGEVKPA